MSQHALFILASLAHHAYEGVALNEDEKPRLVRDLGQASHLMPRNHGLLTGCATVADAFFSMYFFAACCMIQLRAQAGGGEFLRILTPSCRAYASSQVRSRVARAPAQ